MTRFVNKFDDTYCEQCGYPVGNIGRMDDDGAIFCSGRCLKEREKAVRDIYQGIQNFDMVPPIAEAEVIDFDEI